MSSELLEHPYAKQIWDKLYKSIGNAYGVAGLMGNLQAESGLYPDRVQGDVPYSSYSKEYTAKVDSGEISEDGFVNNGPNGGGYGLAQWTYPPRKRGLYDLFKQYPDQYKSIGCVELACDYLMVELATSYSSVYLELVNASTVKDASDFVLHEFENPADQSSEVEALRASMGMAIYNAFNGSTPETPDQPDENKSKRMSKLLLWAVATDTY